MDEFDRWVARYSSFPAGGPYSQEAYGVFPRYRLAEDTLVEVERLNPSASDGISQLKQELLNAGSSAFEKLANEFHNKPPALVALQDELSAYSDYIKQLDAHKADAVEPLPFRRVLSSEEATALWFDPLGTWGVRGPGHGWFPLSDDPKPTGALTFHTELWHARDGYALFQRFLARENVSRCFLLRELGPPDYEVDVELAKPVYDGSETFLFSDRSWIVYASHESSLTLVGTVAEFFREQWSDADSLGYGGPYHTDDLRGTWG